MPEAKPFELGRLEREEWDEFAELVCVSLNFWYRSHGMGNIFSSPAAVIPFLETYEALDPGMCVVARRGRRLVGGCFMHPRETHVSLGIMAVHPNWFSAGVGKALVGEIVRLADARGVPTRLISSAVNMDSFSLYTRAGFVPRKLFQDVLVKVPEEGLPGPDFEWREAANCVDATLNEVGEMVALEDRLLGIRREPDLKYLVGSRGNGWHASVMEDSEGIRGWLASFVGEHAAMVGPGVAENQTVAGVLIHRELNRMRGRTALVLVQADQGKLVQQLYKWGGRNVETHVVQVRGEAREMRGVVMPTFLPETA